LLTEELKSSTDVRDIERYDTLYDVNRSCEAAIDILNDLLCYEKIESGILVLHKEEVTVQPYLFDCLSIFAVQAKECSITMHIDLGVTDAQYQADRESGCQVMLPLQPYDTVFIDKFKVRILISPRVKMSIYKHVCTNTK
jgi:signal transduction histidine kinase